MVDLTTMVVKVGGVCYVGRQPELTKELSIIARCKNMKSFKVTNKTNSIFER